MSCAGEPFAQRVLGDQRRQFPDQVRVATHGQVGLDAFGQHGEPALLQHRRLAGQAAHSGQRRDPATTAAPPADPRRPAPSGGRGGPPGRRHAFLEHVQVHRARLGGQQIAGSRVTRRAPRPGAVRRSRCAPGDGPSPAAGRPRPRRSPCRPAPAFRRRAATPPASFVPAGRQPGPVDRPHTRRPGQAAGIPWMPFATTARHSGVAGPAHQTDAEPMVDRERVPPRSRCSAKLPNSGKGHVNGN
jgi:hypothetical protein